MSDTMTAVCELTTELPESACHNWSDRFRNAVLLPPNVFNELDIDPFHYIEAKPANGASEWANATTLQAVPLSQSCESKYTQDEHIVGVRTNIMALIGEGVDPGESIHLRSLVNPTSDELTVKRSYADSEIGERCYISPQLCSDLKINGVVEVYNPDTGGRSLLPAKELKDWDDENQIGLDLHSQKALDVESGDPMKVQRPVNNQPTAKIRDDGIISKITNKLLEIFIGYRPVSLRVLSGLDRDEHRNILRANEDVMEILGIKPGDRVIIEWYDQYESVQCLLPPEGESVVPYGMLLPSTERDQIGVSINDVVNVHRDQAYFWKKNTALSIFGIIGVFVGFANVVHILVSAQINRLLMISTVLFFAMSLIVLPLVIFGLLYPERQKSNLSSAR